MIAFRRIAANLTLVTIALFTACRIDAQAPTAGLPETASGWIEKSAVRAREFMVAAANPLAVDAGYYMLLQGGSAVDAAIAVQLVLGLVEPQSSGLGGGAFMLVHDATTKRLSVLDARETAPVAARPDRFLGPDGKPLAFRAAAVGGRSVGVPGAVALMADAHRRFGKLSWAELFAPAIALAENGFTVSPRMAQSIANEKPSEDATARAYFFTPDGAPLPAGHRLANAAYAATLRELAANGTASFYRGTIARDIVATANGAAINPGDLTLADLARYRVIQRVPLCGKYRGYRVCGAPPPSSGGIAVLEILGLLERKHFAAMPPRSVPAAHLFAEAGRIAFADRVYVGDPAYASVPSWLLEPSYLDRRADELSPERSIVEAKPGTPPANGNRKVSAAEVEPLELPATSHVSIVDGHGNAVSMTTSIENAFGSHLLTASGFLLNNQLTDFSFVPVFNGEPAANRVEGGKRPRSSMSPTIVYDPQGRLYMIVGAPGGSAIINYVAKTITGVIDWQLDPQAAVSLPNIGSRNGPTELEAGTAATALEPGLRALGHPITVMAHPSGTQAIVRTANGWIGGADPRREGIARGD